MSWDQEAPEPTQWAVICPTHGRVYLTKRAYDAQMNNAGAVWRCPKWSTPEEIKRDPYLIGPCGAPCDWDDDNYENEKWCDVSTT